MWRREEDIRWLWGRCFVSGWLNWSGILFCFLGFLYLFRRILCRSWRRGFFRFRGIRRKKRRRRNLSSSSRGRSRGDLDIFLMERCYSVKSREVFNIEGIYLNMLCFFVCGVIYYVFNLVFFVYNWFICMYRGFFILYMYICIITYNWCFYERFYIIYVYGK